MKKGPCNPQKRVTGAPIYGEVGKRTILRDDLKGRPGAMGRHRAVSASRVQAEISAVGTDVDWNLVRRAELGRSPFGDVQKAHRRRGASRERLIKRVAHRPSIAEGARRAVEPVKGSLDRKVLKRPIAIVPDRDHVLEEVSPPEHAFAARVYRRVPNLHDRNVEILKRLVVPTRLNRPGRSQQADRDPHRKYCLHDAASPRRFAPRRHDWSFHRNADGPNFQRISRRVTRRISKMGRRECGGILGALRMRGGLSNLCHEEFTAGARRPARENGVVTRIRARPPRRCCEGGERRSWGRRRPAPA